jgi:EAL domain-containing protein (putative c-di-GMP-specific phosphodiesterase class I)
MDNTPLYVIDDLPEIAALISVLAENHGLNPTVYTRANDFIEIITQLESDSIVMLDLQMPEVDGVEVMRHLVQLSNPPTLILMSGHDIGVLKSVEKLAKAQNLEILASFTKPLAMEKLKQLFIQIKSTKKTHLNVIKQNARRNFTRDELIKCIEDNQLILHYQPQFDINSKSIVGVEALVRWQHPEHGLLYPDHFIYLAEQYSLMKELTEWVINNIVQQQRQWQSHDFLLVISANVSADNITSLILPEYLATLLEENKLEPEYLTLEMTESALMGELVTSLDILNRLRLKNIKLSIDDFGTGYSSLVQLHRAPFSELKIDRGFVMNMLEDSEALAIVKTCILLGHELNMSVVAEGVENKETFKLLSEMGCDIAQGYYISKPMPADDLIPWMRNDNENSFSLISTC